MTSVAVDEDGGFVYFNTGVNQIKRAKLDGSGVTDIYLGK